MVKTTGAMIQTNQGRLDSGQYHHNRLGLHQNCSTASKRPADKPATTDDKDDGDDESYSMMQKIMV